MFNPKETRLLIVEPDERTRNFLVQRLTSSGYGVDSAESYAQGRDYLEAIEAYHAPDVVLLGQNGRLGPDDEQPLDLLDTIFRIMPGTGIIILSTVENLCEVRGEDGVHGASSSLTDALAAFRAGACDFVTMPMNHPEVLEKSISNCLERRALALEVDAAESRYFHLIQNLPIVIFALNADFQLEFINKTCEDVLGYSPETALQTPDWFMSKIASAQRETVRQNLGQCLLGGGEPVEVEFDFEHGNGYPIRLSARPISCTDNHLPSRWRRVEGIIQDISRRTFLDRVMVQREKLNTLGALSAELAHEMRNPLMSLGGFARRLADKHPDLMEARIILEEAGRLESVLDKVRDYLRPVPTTPADVNVNGVITFCRSLTTTLFAERGVSCVVNTDPMISLVVSDQDVLTQAFASLFSACCERMQSGDVLEITTREGSRNVTASFRILGRKLVVQDPEMLLMPFDDNGDRLNLALSYRLVQSVGGLISLDGEQEAEQPETPAASAESVTSFSVLLPKIRPPSPEDL